MLFRGFYSQTKTLFEKYLAAVTVPIEEELQDEKFLQVVEA